MDVSKIAIQIASEFTGSKAFKQAETSTQKLQRQVKNLGRSLGLALGTAAIVKFGKASVKAFAEDDNAARSLSKTLENLGLNTRYAGSEVNGYISRLEKQTGVLDDELRPAMDRLLRATGSITSSQQLLSLALDISAGTGKDLTAVSQGLQKAYLGNNASLGRLGVGLTKAELKSSSFIDIQTKLTKLFAGQAKDAADSFQGSLNKLTIASNNAKEAIGKGLVDSLIILGGSNYGGTTGAVNFIDKMASGIADGTKNIAFMIKQFEALKPVIIALGALLLIYFAPVTAAVAALAYILAKGGANLKKASFAKGIIPGGAGGLKSSMTLAGQTENLAGKKQRLKIEKQQNTLLDSGNKLKSIDNANTTRKLLLTGDELALQELTKKMDIERIQINAALMSTTDRETQLRLLSLMAIHDNDAALAGKVLAEINATKAVDGFAKAAADAAARLLQTSYSAGLSSFKQSEINSNLPAAGGGASATAPALGNAGLPAGSVGGSMGFGDAHLGAIARQQAPTTVVVNVAGSVTTQQDLVTAFTNAMYNNQASGTPPSFTTAFR
jgi:hypothetical protein